MDKSPTTTRPGGRRASILRLARILAEHPRRRLAFAALALAAFGWTALAVAYECSQALRFRLVDPWPANQPALWTPDSGHVERLDAAAVRLRTCLSDETDADATLAVSADPALGYQGLYWSLWVISRLPERQMRLLGTDGDVGSARFLVSATARPDLELVCSAAPLRLYALRSGVSESAGEAGR